MQCLPSIHRYHRLLMGRLSPQKSLHENEFRADGRLSRSEHTSLYKTIVRETIRKERSSVLREQRYLSEAEESLWCSGWLKWEPSRAAVYPLLTQVCARKGTGHLVKLPLPLVVMSVFLSVDEQFNFYPDDTFPKLLTNWLRHLFDRETFLLCCPSVRGCAVELV